MNIRQLASAIARKEGHQSKSRIEDLTKVLSILSDMSYQTGEPFHVIQKNGIARQKRRSLQK